jgi:hypothetical protein
VAQSEKAKTSKEGTAMRVFKTLAIWFGISLLAATIVAIIPNVRPCFQSGFGGCWTATVDGFKSKPKATDWSDPRPMDWVILVVGLVVAVRIMFPAVDPLADDTVAPEKSQTT